MATADEQIRVSDRVKRELDRGRQDSTLNRPADVVDEGDEDEFAELTKPAAGGDGFADRALDR